MTNVLERLSAARTTLVLDSPFFGALSLRMRFVEAPHITSTMATDGRSLFYCEGYVSKLSDEQLVGLLAHEVMHPAMAHHVRRGGRDHQGWNVACDHAINPMLKDAGFKLPEGALIEPAFLGKSAEQIYALFPKQEGGKSSSNTGGNGNGQSQGDDDGDNDDDDDDDDDDDGQGQGQGQGQGNNDGSQGPGRHGLGDMPGAVLDAPDPHDDAAEWQIAVAQAAQAAKMMGRLPGQLARLVQDVLEPKVDWKNVLRRFMQQCAAADYSWSMPSRRYMGMGLYLPTLRSESMPPVVVAIDTSGSIGADELATFKAELQSIIDECQPEATHVIYCDAAVHEVQVFDKHEQLGELKCPGGGGTDFRPVFDHVEHEQLHPACVIYLTDGYGTYPNQHPDYPVLWAMTTKREAPWGETVKVTM